MIVPVLICGMVFLGCKKKDDENDKRVIVLLIDSDSYEVFEKTVLLYENENYLIKTPLLSFLSNLNAFYEQGYDDYFAILEKIISDGKTNNLLYSSSYFANRTDYILAGFLEGGHCYFYDKKNKKNIEQVVIEYWESFEGKKGRKFYINNNVLFLEIVDQ